MNRDLIHFAGLAHRRYPKTPLELAVMFLNPTGVLPAWVRWTRSDAAAAAACATGSARIC